MIYDDLPTNLDYIVDSYGTAAGLREFQDDDLDEFDVEEQQTGFDSSADARITSRIGGETIKLLRPEGIKIIENYFDNSPADTEEDNSRYGYIRLPKNIPQTLFSDTRKQRFAFASTMAIWLCFSMMAMIG